MKDIVIKEFNKEFLDKINNLFQTKESIGKINNKDLNDLHRVMAEGILNTMYEYFPTILIFNPYFLIFSSEYSSVQNNRMWVPKKESKFHRETEHLSDSKREELIERGIKRRALSSAHYKKFTR